MALIHHSDRRRCNLEADHTAILYNAKLEAESDVDHRAEIQRLFDA
jgi:hypothetical protein